MQLKPLLSEYRYDSETLVQSRYIFNQFKRTLGKKYSEEVEGYLDGIYYDLTFELIPTDFETLGPQPFIIDAAADYDSVEIVINYNKDAFPKSYNDLNAELKDTIRHELEHVGQANFNKGIPFNTIDLPFHKYLTSAAEVPAFIKGLYKNAKTRKITLRQSIDDFLQSRESELTDQQEAYVRKVWDRWIRIHLPRVKY